jgi:hypothetical protein
MPYKKRLFLVRNAVKLMIYSNSTVIKAIVPKDCCWFVLFKY